MVVPPGAGARAGLQPHAAHPAVGGHLSLVRSGDADGRGGHQGAGRDKARVERLDVLAVVGQLAVEVAGVGEIVTDAAGRAELGERGADPGQRKAGAVGEQAELDGGLEVQQHADQVGVALGLVGGQVVEDRALPGETAPAAGREDQRVPHAGQLDLPRAGLRVRAGAGRRAVHPQGLDEAEQRHQRGQPADAGQAPRPVQAPR
ncbi:hypothetical protein [Microtetraspora sp. NBRC 13810]|uniref:hypothetical protein n=1 Tax=Microtetraspora sp. NBRC 13810 TaxID=3030990 RepID=UPI0025533485|nr:hypothetical protein [Microtetraspora sp. NBRC 13810]